MARLRTTCAVLLVLASCAFLVGAGTSTARAATFQHPGVLVSQAQLNFIKQQVATHTDPIWTEFQDAQKSTYGSLTYKPQGPPSGGTIDCGSFSNPDIGCSAEDEDGTAAYTQALLWTITGNQTYATNAITILNAYGHNLKNYTNSNAPLQAAWGASKWARAAEIIRYSNAGWAPADATAFGQMMTSAELPLITNGSTNNGNWELSMIEGMIGIAVYNNDMTLFNHAVTFWHQRVPAYFYYFPVDGTKHQVSPRGTSNWNGQTVFDASTSGVAQETCRDFGHTEFGIAATMAAAETAHIQGVDLYGSEKGRLETTLEFHAKYLNGASVPSSVCGGHVTLASRPTFEIGYNEFHNRLGDSLPQTLQWLQNGVRTQPVEVDHHMMVFETLTHGADAGSGAVQPDFSLSATPASQTVTQGGSTSYSVSVSASGGFNGAVALSASGLPAGATATFNPASVTGSGTSTMTVQTSASTPAGTSSVTILGQSGSTSHTAGVSLVVQAPNQQDFAVSATPASQSVQAGSSTSYQVTITPSNGYSGTVALSAGGLPSGATATFNPASVSGGSGTSTMTVATTSSAPASTSQVTITGTDGAASLSHSASVSLTITPPSVCAQTTQAGPWQNTAFANQTGSFTAQFDATPAQNKMNGVVGLSNGAQTAYTGFAAIARFNPSGDIDARSGGSYTAASTIPYTAGTTYHFRMVVDISAHTYSTFVTPAGGSELTVGSNFAFRSEQSSVSQLNWWGAFSEVGSEKVCGFSIG